MFEKKATKQEMLSMFDDIQNEFSELDRKYSLIESRISILNSEHQTHLTRFTELKAWVIQFCTDMKNAPVDMTDIQNRINNLEGKQKTLDALFISEKPVTKEPTLSPMAKKLRRKGLLDR